MLCKIRVMQIPPGLSGTINKSNIFFFTHATDHDLDHLDPCVYRFEMLCKSCNMLIPPGKLRAREVPCAPPPKNTIWIVQIMLIRDLCASKDLDHEIEMVVMVMMMMMMMMAMMTMMVMMMMMMVMMMMMMFLALAHFSFPSSLRVFTKTGYEKTISMDEKKNELKYDTRVCPMCGRFKTPT